MTPLYIAAQRNNTAVAKLLIERGAIVDAMLDDGATPLCVAAVHNSTETAELLLVHGANVNHAMYVLRTRL